MEQGFAFPTFTPATINSLNVRSENHGSDQVPAIDLRMMVTGSNEMLRMFGVGWLIGHYIPADVENDAEPELDGIDPMTPRPKLRFQAGKIDIPLAEYIGVNLVIDFGLGGRSNIELFGDANKFKADLRDGGSIDLSFRFQASGLKGTVIGKLGELIKHGVKITALRSTEADGTLESIDSAPVKPKVESKTPIQALTEAVDPKAAAKSKREAERAQKFPVAAKKAAAKKKPAVKARAKK